MKKVMKLCKIFLVLVTIFSQLSSVVTVLADEITEKPLSIILEQVMNDDGSVKEYNFSYKSSNGDYEEYVTDESEESTDSAPKLYDIVLTSSFTYLDNEVETNIKVIEDVTGKSLNNDRNVMSVGAISSYFDGTFNLNVKVLEDDGVVYEDTSNILENREVIYATDIEYVVDNTLKGLTGNLNGTVMPKSENVGTETSARYEVEDKIEYIQNLQVRPGELTPSKTYRVVYNDTELGVMTGLELIDFNIIGSMTDLYGKLAGEYNTEDIVIIEEVVEKTNDVDSESSASSDNYTVVKEFVYSYNSTIKYGTDNDELFSDRYGIVFEDGYIIVPAKNYLDTDRIITIGEISNLLVDSGITLEVSDNDGNVLDLLNEEVLNSEIKNDYMVNFTSGATASYKVVVTADINNDNEFTKEDILPTIEKYIENEDSLSMDVYDEDEKEFGAITFEDLMELNENLKDENLDVSYENKDLELLFGGIPSEIYVGDTFELDVLINLKEITEEEFNNDEVIVDSEENLEDNNAEINTEEDILDEEEITEEIIQYIDGIDAFVSTLGNVKLTDVKFNDALTGTYNEEGRVVGVGAELTSSEIVVTLVFTAIKDGNDTIELSGNIASYLNIREFDALTKEVEVKRVLSSNNYLSSLSASVGTFDSSFDKENLVYTLTVPYNTESVILSGILDDEYSTVNGLDEYKLIEDKTTAIIRVTAEDGSEKVYTVYIIKEAAPVIKPVVYYYSSNNNLKLLEITGYEIDFKSEVTEYNITVSNDVNSLDIKALAQDYKSRVEITGNSDFKDGENIVTIKVTAEDGSTKDYKIIVNKEVKENSGAGIDTDSNTAEKVVIIILIILVVMGLLYLIFKKDDDELNEKLEKLGEDDNKSLNKSNNKNNDKNSNNKNDYNKKKKK